jgi:hypothetical protein
MRYSIQWLTGQLHSHCASLGSNLFNSQVSGTLQINIYMWLEAKECHAGQGPTKALVHL